MKKSVFEAIHNYLNGDETVDLSVVREEVNAEWDKMQEKANANRKAYNDAKEVAFAVMSDKPMLAKEVFAAGGDKWPHGFTVNKVQYALTHYWNDEVVKHDNGKSAFTYSLK